MGVRNFAFIISLDIWYRGIDSLICLEMHDARDFLLGRLDIHAHGMTRVQLIYAYMPASSGVHAWRKRDIILFG
jgi:hypothetical protein